MEMSRRINRSTLLLLLAAAAVSMMLFAVLQQRSPSWSGQIRPGASDEGQTLSIGRFRTVEECRVSGTANLQRRGWSGGTTTCSDDRVKRPAPEAAERRFKVSDGVATELPSVAQ